MTEVVAADHGDWTIVDVSSEDFREYIYGNGGKFRINRPVTLYVLANGSHRVVAENGLTYRPERGYVGISWLPKKGEKPFVA